MSSSRPFVPLVTLILVAIPSLLWASGAAHRHDGFFLRLAGGVGFSSSKIDDNVDELELSGACGDLEVAIGGMVATNLALHGTLLGWTISDPDLEANGNDVGDLEGDLTLSGAGIGITYFFMPTNLYLSGSVGFGKLNLDLQGLGNADSDTGFVFEGTVGKEWWVSSNWGIGVSGVVGFHSIPDDGIDERWNGANLAVRFSATFN